MLFEKACTFVQYKGRALRNKNVAISFKTKHLRLLLSLFLLFFSVDQSYSLDLVGDECNLIYASSHLSNILLKYVCV